MFRQVSKVLFQRSCCIDRTIVDVSTFSHKYIKRFISRSYLRCDNLENYFEKLEARVKEDLYGYTNQIPNSKLLILLEKRKNIINNLNTLANNDCHKEQSDTSEEWNALLKEEQDELVNELKIVNKELVNELVSNDNNANNVMLEVKAGVGGKEAMLFAKILFDMYTNYSNYKRWNCVLIQNDTAELGGLRHGSISIEGIDTFKHLHHESGVHRVQRVPLTEKTGRLHTSTVTVAVLPQPTNIECVVQDKDLVIETFRASGAGGQHVNKTDSAVRITHIPSKIVVECQTDRSQIRNKLIALQKLRTIMYERQIKLQETELRNSRKLQVGTSSRSDKVRTYNFAQDRVTDHRLGINVHNIESFIKGGRELDGMIQKMIEELNSKKVEDFLCNIEHSLNK